MLKSLYWIFFMFFTIAVKPAFSCSVIYYVDSKSGKVYVANNEDYWYNVKTFLQIVPAHKNTYARLWYGWDNFAQGGVNEKGLFFDGAVSPIQEIPDGYKKPGSNLGNEILANCKSVNEAIAFLESKKIALNNAHIMFGDKTGNAAVVEWVDGERKIVPIKEKSLFMTNFLLSDTSKGNYPCYRYNAIESAISDIDSKDTIKFSDIAHVASKALQPAFKNEEGKVGGTLYSSFINLTDMEFILVYKLDNAKVTKLNLNHEFALRKKRKIKL